MRVFTILQVLLAVELSLRCRMCDPLSKFEEYRTKTAVAIVDDMYFRQTHTE